jgi:hypothetical protein
LVGGTGGIGCESTRVHRAARLRGGYLAARGARTAADDAGDRVSLFGPLAPIANPVAAFRKGLSEMGYTEGQNVAFAFRSAENDNARLPELAAELVRRQVAVFAAPGSPAAAGPAPLRIWMFRDDRWQLALSQQVALQSAAPVSAVASKD